MPNSDQLKHMKTPIPLRASRERTSKKAPQPLLIPKRSILDKPLTLRDLSKILFTIGHYDEQESGVVEMTVEEFDAFMARVLEDE